MRTTIIVLAVMLASLITTSTAQAGAFPWSKTNDAEQRHEQRVLTLRHEVRHWRRLTLSRAVQVGPAFRPVGPITTRAVPYLLWLRDAWHQRAQHYAALIVAAQSAPAPSTVTATTPASSGSLIADFNCISTKEEYGVTGQNTTAGYFGMPSPPSAYPSPGPEYAAQYGDSWLNIPLAAQYQIAIAEYETYGWYPTWSTAHECGLY